MFKTLIKIANVWVAATDTISRSQARRIANAYRAGLVSPYVVAAKVVRVSDQ